MKAGKIYPFAALLVTIAAMIAGMAAGAWLYGYRVNLTPSEPLGLWRIEPIRRPAAVGDRVFVCPPPTAPFQLAFERGYLGRGLCPGGFAPLIKSIAALAGETVEIDTDVMIDGRVLAASTVRASDGEGRSIAPFAGGVVPPGHLFLHSRFMSSYDSRYFGPVPEQGLLGLARPVLVFDP